MKTNWNLIIVLAIVIAVFFGIYKIVKVYNKNVETISDNSLMIDSLNNKILDINKSETLNKLYIQKLEEKDLVTTTELKSLKNKVYEIRNKKDDSYDIIFNDSIRTSIFTEYFISKNVPLYYSR